MLENAKVDIERQHRLSPYFHLSCLGEKTYPFPVVPHPGFFYSFLITMSVLARQFEDCFIHSFIHSIFYEPFNDITAVHEDIKYFSYKKRKSQFLSQAMKNKRKDCVAKLLNKFKYSLLLKMLWFFSDEKIFCQDHMNSQKNCWPALSPQDVLNMDEN